MRQLWGGDGLIALRPPVETLLLPGPLPGKALDGSLGQFFLVRLALGLFFIHG